MTTELEKLWEELTSQDMVIEKNAAPTDPKEVCGNVSSDILETANGLLQRIQEAFNGPISAESEPQQTPPDGTAPNGMPNGGSVRFEVPSGMTVKVASVDGIEDALTIFGALGMLED